MSEVKWIKLKTDMFDDEKIKIIQSMPDGDSLCLIWIRLLTLAGKTNDGGYIYISDNLPYTDEMLSVVFNKPLNTIRMALDTFSKLQMIDSDVKGIYLINFDKHQSLEKLEKIKEQNRLRKQRQREKEKQLLLPNNDSVTSHVTVTQSHATDIDIDLDKDLDKEIDKDKDIKEYISPPLGEFNNVLLTSLEYSKLKERNLLSYIDTLSIYLENNPKKKYRSHYATILSWSRKDEKTGKKPVRKEVVPEWLDKGKDVVSVEQYDVENNGKDSWKAEAERLKRELDAKY